MTALYSIFAGSEAPVIDLSRSWQIMQGDALSMMAQVPDESMHTCITSPPYLWLRDYGTGGTHWPAFSYLPMTGYPALEFDTWQGNLGMEPTPEMFIGHLVLICREIWRVLRADGLFWLNIGDSYSSKAGDYAAGGSPGSTSVRGKRSLAGMPTSGRSKRSTQGIAPKNLLLIPQRLALALQADGWAVRKHIVWHKSTAMPESVQDRPASAHEIILMLSKSSAPLYWVHQREAKGTRCQPKPDYVWVNRETEEIVDAMPEGWDDKQNKVLRKLWERRNLWKAYHYFYDWIAVRQPASPASYKRINQKSFSTQQGGEKDFANQDENTSRSARRALENFADDPGANLRDVWVLPPAQFADAHFATFPAALPERCILASTSGIGCCPACGAPYARLTKIGGQWQAQHERQAKHNGKHYRTNPGGGVAGVNTTRVIETRGWAPTCDCGAGEPVPARVFDPFSGAGTTGLEARRLMRHYLGIELNPEYVLLSEKRIGGDMPLFNQT